MIVKGQRLPVIPGKTTCFNHPEEQAVATVCAEAQSNMFTAIYFCKECLAHHKALQNKAHCDLCNVEAKLHVNRETRNSELKALCSRCLLDQHIAAYDKVNHA